MSDELIKRLTEAAPIAANGHILTEAAQTVERLTRELDAARKDAERYRWLRSTDNNGEYMIAAHGPDTLDDAIDREIEAGTQNIIIEGCHFTESEKVGIQLSGAISATTDGGKT